jgi:HEAT repeats
MNKCSLVVGAAMLLTALTPSQSQAWVRLGIGINVPIYPRPYYYGPYGYPYGYPYYQPYPVYVAPAPVYVGPPPSGVQPAPVYQPAPVVRAQDSRSQSFDETGPPPQAVTVNQGEMGRLLQQLSNQEERTRCDAALELGRMKAQQAIDPLCTLLSSDRSSQVRETAARALGLIGSARALGALQNSALADNDREVRHSAQFSAEVIRASLRRD